MLNKRIILFCEFVSALFIVLFVSIPFSYALAPKQHEKNLLKEQVIALLNEEVNYELSGFVKDHVLTLGGSNHLHSLKGLLEMLDLPEDHPFRLHEAVMASFCEQNGIFPADEALSSALKISGVAHAIRAKKQSVSVDVKTEHLNKALNYAMLLIQMEQFKESLEIIGEMGNNLYSLAPLTELSLFVNKRLESIPEGDPKRLEFLRIKGKIGTSLFSFMKSKRIFSDLKETLLRLRRAEKYDAISDILWDLFKILPPQKIMEEGGTPMEVLNLLREDLIPLMKDFEGSLDLNLLVKDEGVLPGKEYELCVYTQALSLRIYFLQSWFSILINGMHKPSRFQVDFQEYASRVLNDGKDIPKLLNSMGEMAEKSALALKALFHTNDMSFHLRALNLLVQMSFNSISSPEEAENVKYPLLSPLFSVTSLLDSLADLHPKIPYREYKVIVYSIFFGLGLHSHGSPEHPAYRRFLREAPLYLNEAHKIVEGWERNKKEWGKWIFTFSFLTEYADYFHPFMGQQFAQFWYAQFLETITSDNSEEFSDSIKLQAVLRQVKYFRQAEGKIPVSPEIKAFVEQGHVGNARNLKALINNYLWETVKQFCIDAQETLSDDCWNLIEQALPSLELPMVPVSKAIKAIDQINQLRHDIRLVMALPDDHPLFETLVATFESDKGIRDGLHEVLRDQGMQVSVPRIYRRITASA